LSRENDDDITTGQNAVVRKKSNNPYPPVNKRSHRKSPFSTAKPSTNGNVP